MIKCLSEERIYQTLFARWNETKVDREAVEKEYIMIKAYINHVKNAFERVSKEYNDSKIEFANVNVEKLLAEKENKENAEGFDWQYNNAKSYMLRQARFYEMGKAELERTKELLKNYNKAKRKVKVEEKKAKKTLGLYLEQYTNELFVEREHVEEELKLYREECEEKFGHWYDINEAKDYSNAEFCKCVFCERPNYDIPWYNKNYISKTYLSERWTNEHQEALTKINFMKETLKEIQESLELICFAKEKHEYGEKKPHFPGGSYHECKICGHTEYDDDYED